MRIEYLRYFLDISRTMSISKTADNFFMSQQGMSRSIRSLEEEFGVVLLERKGNMIKLTPAGKDFALYAQGTVDKYQQLKEQMSTYKRNNKDICGSVTINTTPYVINFILPFLKGTIFTDLPAINLKTIEHDSTQIIDDITYKTNNNYDELYLISFPSSCSFKENIEEELSPKNISYYPILSLPVMAKLSKNSPCAFKKILTAKELKTLPIVCPSEPLFRSSISSVINPENIIFRCSNPAMANEVILANNAVGFGPGLEMDEHIITLQFENSFSTEVGFLINKNKEYNPKTLEVINYIINYCKKHFPKYLVINM